MEANVYYHISIENDIDLSYHYWNPLYSSANAGKLIINGNNNDILNLKIDSSNIVNEQPFGIGLIGLLDYGSKIENLNVYGEIYITSFNGDSYIGGLVGTIWTSTIKNVNSYIDINVEKTLSCTVGGIAGRNHNSTFIECGNYGNISAPKGGIDDKGCGGVIGGQEPSSVLIEIVDCKNYGNIFGYNNVAGIIGSLVNSDYNISSSILGCANYGNVTCMINNNLWGLTGGIVGQHAGSGAIINCVNYGEIFAKAGHIGGIAGNGYNIENCKNFGNITGTERVGGITGVNSSDEIKNCLVECNITLLSENFKNAGGIVGAISSSENKIINIKNSFFRGNVFCNNTSDLDAKNVFSGIAGARREGDALNFTLNVINCFADYQINYTNGKVAPVGALANSSQGGTYVINSCYQDVRLVTLNEGNLSKKEYTSGDFSGWDYLQGFNNNLPMQKELFAIAQFGEHTGSEVIAYLQKKNFKLI